MSAAQTTDSALRLSLLVGSDYKLNGLSQTSSQPVLRFAADYEHSTGLFAGGFAANAEYAVENHSASQRDSQASLYAGYLRRGGNWSGNVSLARYVYPGVSPDYDYAELSAGIAYKNRYFVVYSRSSDYLSLGQRAYQYRAGIRLPWIAELEASVNAGKFRTRGFFDTSFSFWDIGLSRAFGRFALDLRYHDDTYDRATRLGESGDDRWVISISYAITPRDR
jgi:uncharacterized protein (TIGR02001 family)